MTWESLEQFLAHCWGANVNTQLPGELYFSDNVEFWEKFGNELTIAGRERTGWFVKITATDVTSNICCSRYVDFIIGNSTLSLGLAFPRSVAIAFLCFPSCQHPLLHKQTHHCLLDINLTPFLWQWYTHKGKHIRLMVTWPHSSTITLTVTWQQSSTSRLTVMWPQNPIQKTSGHVTYKQNKSDGQTSGLIQNSTSSTAIFHIILKKRVLKDQLPDKFTLFSGRLAWFGSYHRSIPVQKTISLTTFIHTDGFFSGQTLKQ